VTLSDHPYGAAIGDGLLSQAAPQGLLCHVVADHRDIEAVAMRARRMAVGILALTTGISSAISDRQICR
jgi:hypothetical protein